MTNERGFTMFLHSLGLGVIAYVIIAKQPQSVAENRSLLFAAIALIYMLLFGHKLPF